MDIISPCTRDVAVAVLLGDGKGRFRHAPGSPFKVEMPMHLAALGDLNGDRKPDLVTAHDDSDLITILPNDGRGAFKGYEHHIGSRAWGVVLADVNGDRRTDLSAATNDSVTVLFGDGGGSFWAAPGSPFPTGGGSWKAALGDVNRDGHPDIVANNLEKNSVTVLLGR